MRFSTTIELSGRTATGFEVPANLTTALAVLNVEGAKTPETRARRIDKSVTMLREGRAR